jgi:hypothetical protein
LDNSKEPLKSIAVILSNIRDIEEKFAKIQENPALYGADGFTADELKIFEQLIVQTGEINIAGNAIAKRVLGIAV